MSEEQVIPEAEMAVESQQSVEDTTPADPKIAEMRKHISALNEENKNHRLKAKEESRQKLEALEQNGEYKALAEALTDRVQELESTIPELKEQAGRYTQWRETESDKIEKEIENIPTHWREVVSGAADFETKRRILDSLKVSHKAPPPSAQASAPGNSSAGSTPKDLAALWMSKQSKKGIFNR
tara:strand:- start:8799 stop:9347 length:549 start_codon:yes stop_codon:yes gene_type:complete